jgi:hypothetical protein
MRIASSNVTDCTGANVCATIVAGRAVVAGGAVCAEGAPRGEGKKISRADLYARLIA